MTRWARSGSTQRHRKPPENSTPWKEFSSQLKQKSKFAQQFKGGRIEKKGNFNNISKGIFRNLNHTPVKNIYITDEVRKHQLNNKTQLKQSNLSEVYNSKIAENSNNIDNAIEELNARKNCARKIIPKELSTKDSIGSDNNVSDKTVTSNTKIMVLNKKKKKRNYNLSNENDIEQNDALSYQFNDKRSYHSNNLKKKKKVKNNFKKSRNDANIIQEEKIEDDKIERNDSNLYQNIEVHVIENETNLEIEVKKNKKCSLKKMKRIQLKNSELIVDQITLPNTNQIKNKRKKQRSHPELDAQNLKPKDSDVEKNNDTLTEVCTQENEESLATIDNRSKKDIKKQRKRVDNIKQKWLTKVKERRLQNGIILLPQKAERKLYLMKKKLREKGMPGEKIKEMVRETRRKEELKFRKTTVTKSCFNCRQTGHILSSCPMIKADVEQGTGICFKCGSTEHTSYRCHLKISDFPFAKCFICQKQGHLSRKCPENSCGVFPKGGKCHLCGDIDHLKRDCPKLKKIGDDDSMTISTISGLMSVDDDMADTKMATAISVQESKIVKFN